ncbi:hypothetical protein SteCoe_33093 [Stentor coeruleus]|uniref:Uncharacterized protein n=1 Tax=Stentor coeruleus TaxID=5963 RepID=A0A1R2AXY3_9CILI|nr:hypothetical protein SteCoe_33093 [Stentor coeruleus]
MSTTESPLVSCMKASQISSNSHKKSLESIYDSLSSLNFSILSSQISSDSCSPSLIKQKNEQIRDFIKNRITALHYFSQVFTTELEEDTDENLITESNVSIIEKTKDDKQNDENRYENVDCKILLEEIYGLMENYEKERKKLEDEIVEINALNEEEEDLVKKLKYYENKFANLVMEKKSENVGCRCDIF